MGGPTLIQLVAWAATGVCVLGALWLLWLARFRDKDRDKARCPKCWYELGTLTSPPALPVTCPECGKKVETLRQLQRRRLRRLPILAALPLLLAAWVCWELPQIDQRGWLWLVPNRVLFELLARAGSHSSIQDQFDQRLGMMFGPNNEVKRTMSDDDVADLVRWCAKGTWLARPIEPRWRDPIGLLLHSTYATDVPFPGSDASIAQGGKTTASLIAAMDEVSRIPPDIFQFSARERWPIGQLPGVRVRVVTMSWWPNWWEMSREIEWSATNDRNEHESGTSELGQYESWLRIPILGAVDVDAEVKFYRVLPASAGGGRKLLASTPLRFRYTAVSTIDDAISPVRDTALDDALTRVGIYVRGGSLLVDPSSLTQADWFNITFPVRVVIRRGDRVVARGNLVWIGSSTRMLLYSRPDMDTDSPEGRSLMAGLIPPGLTITFTSDPSLAFQADSLDRYWAGEVTFPLPPGPMKAVPSPPGAGG